MATQWYAIANAFASLKFTKANYTCTQQFAFVNIKIPDNTQVSAKLRSLAEKYNFDVSRLAAGMCYASLMQSAPDDSHHAADPVTDNSTTSSTPAAAPPTLGLFDDLEADLEIPVLTTIQLASR